MIYELREYKLKLDSVSEFLSLFEKVLTPNFEPCGLDLVGAWMTSVGPGAHTDFVWMLRWKDLGDRKKAFDKLHAVDGYAEYLRLNPARAQSVSSRFLEPTKFSPAR